MAGYSNVVLWKLLWLFFVANLWGWAPSTAVAQNCEPVTAEKIQELLNQSRSKIYLVKFDAALEKLDEAEAGLTCAIEPVSRSTLSQLYLFRGVAAFNKGNEKLAMESFRQAVVINRAIRWEDRFGQRPREIFIEAKEMALLAEKATLILPTMKPRVLAYVDGEATASGLELKVSPGQHFVQVKDGIKMVENAIFRVEDGAQMEVPIPPKYVEGGARVAAGQGDKPAQAEPSKPFEWSKLRPLTYVAFGLGGACLLGGAGAGFATWSTQKELLDGYYSNRDDTTRDELLNKQSTTAILADVGFGGAIVFGGAGAALLFLTAPSDSEDTVSVVYPWFGPASAGFGVRGSF